ncbi:MAG: hypothetical protein D6820_09385 [Lentisphaerae bacterium]|nr:MAG: hypothetical protein D6820_09385 [Lentisphaerota bacterium]
MKSKKVLAALRTVTILETIGSHREQGITLKAMAEILDVSPPATFHLLQTLVEAGFLLRTEQPPRYFSGPRLHELALELAADKTEFRLEQRMRRLIEPYPGAAAYYCELRGNELMVIHEMRHHNEDLRLKRNINRFLAPYSSIASLIHLAFWPDSLRRYYESSHAFEVHGVVPWGNPARLEQTLEQIRQQGYYVSAEEGQPLRFGFPYHAPNGVLQGSLTLVFPRHEAVDASALGTWCRRILDDPDTESEQNKEK